MGLRVGNRGRGPTRPFPSVTFEDALFLPKSILENGVNGQIERIALLDKLDYPRNSSKTRDWITGSSKYGLTSGSHSASFLAVTDDGRLTVDSDSPSRAAKEKQFNLAIQQFDHFNSIYERLKGQHLPDLAVLHGELRRTGLTDSASHVAAEVFTANLRFLGLVQEIDGSEFVRDTLSRQLMKWKRNSNLHLKKHSMAILLSTLTRPSRNRLWLSQTDLHYTLIFRSI